MAWYAYCIVEQQTFQAKAEVVWKDAFAMGIRFLRVDSACQSGFEGWLESLESQMRLRESSLVPTRD